MACNLVSPEPAISVRFFALTMLLVGIARMTAKTLFQPDSTVEECLESFKNSDLIQITGTRRAEYSPRLCLLLK